ncbi:MAG: YeeE/YedE family protein [Pseudohongiellaceae bacterium]
MDTPIVSPATNIIASNRVSIAAAAALATALYFYLSIVYGWRQGALFIVGLAAGIILYHAAFGFTAAWREVVSTGRGAGLRAQMIMLGVTVLIFTPLIAQGELWGTSLRGSVAPLNIAVVCGAFMFGLGMQLGGGCASGTLFTAGGGNMRMLITLAAFIAGSVLGTWQWSSWQGVPGFEPFSLAENYGTVWAIIISLGLFTAVWLASSTYERHRHGSLKSDRDVDRAYSWLAGPWPLIAGALALAAVNVSTLLLAGRPWGVTSAFALWGGKAAVFLGIDVTQWAYWQRPGLGSALEESLFVDITSVMNIGIILGALLAAGLAGKFAPNFRIPFKSVVAAVVGGILLGYGARIAYGCNIGAYFGGIGSTSLHGWLWFAAAFFGSSLGTRLRPYFDLK